MFNPPKEKQIQMYEELLELHKKLVRDKECTTCIHHIYPLEYTTRYEECAIGCSWFKNRRYMLDPTDCPAHAENTKYVDRLKEELEKCKRKD